MGLKGRLVAAIEFKAGGDVFHQLLKENPHHIATASPTKVQACNLHQGKFGTVGSIISWNFVHEGKNMFCKDVIQKIDEENKLIEFKVLEGDVMEKYKDVVWTNHVETKGDIDLVTWTLEYETLNEDVEHPITLLALMIDVTKDIETHHLRKP